MIYETLSPEILLQTKRQFTELGWEDEELLKRFCNAISFLNIDQQRMILDLTKNYLRIDSTKYIKYLKIALLKIDQSVIKSINRIYILPLLKKDDYGKGNKSGYFLSRFFQMPEITTLEMFTGKKLFVLDKPHHTGDERLDLLKSLHNKQALLILIDDFIGSGKTGVAALNYLVGELNLSIRKMIIVTLVAQKEGYQRIQEQYNTGIYCCEIRNKGISDNYNSPKKERYTFLMREIEDLINARDDCRFGFNRSEALITLTRTPNNTFPFFWERKKINEKEFTGVFPR